MLTNPLFELGIDRYIPSHCWVCSIIYDLAYAKSDKFGVLLHLIYLALPEHS